MKHNTFQGKKKKPWETDKYSSTAWEFSAC